jgi:hypothetical protein
MIGEDLIPVVLKLRFRKLRPKYKRAAFRFWGSSLTWLFHPLLMMIGWVRLHLALHIAKDGVHSYFGGFELFHF